MAHAFIEEDAFITSAKRQIFAEPRNLSFALQDLKTEGFANLTEIAAEYGISPALLTNRWVRAHGEPAC
jgi:hypothetical protein